MKRATLWNLALAVLIGVLFGVSPHTSANRVPIKIAGGVAIGIAALVLLPRLRAPGPPAPAPGEACAGKPTGHVPRLLWVALTLAALVFLPAAAGLYRHFTEDIWTNGHGLFVLPAVAALALATLRRDPSPSPESSAWGYLPLALGLVLIVLDSAVGTLHMSIVGLLLLLVGLSLLVLGPRRTRSLAFPLLLILFLAPLPTSLSMPLGLTEATAAGTASLLQALGVPVLREETLLLLPRFEYGVSANCSGFSALYAAVGFALVLGYVGRSRLRSLVLLLATWPLAVLASILRSAAIVTIWEVAGHSFHETPLHGLSGIAAFWLVMGVLFLMAGPRRLREAFS